jgi:hypothetical protein
MADDLSKRGQADRLRINVNEKYELAYWIEELGVREPQLRELVHAHGVMAAQHSQGSQHRMTCHL